MSAKDLKKRTTPYGKVDGIVDYLETFQAAAQPDSTATDIAGLKADFNALLAKLRAAGIIAS
ncbi:head fiber protein [Paenibacillus puldeungensis]|uniref:Head fiber protein n=1 Tax=Paenibacillus puldeungensis TaxID=696536 RepID=A0ABW3S3C5_9BACL